MTYAVVQWHGACIAIHRPHPEAGYEAANAATGQNDDLWQTPERINIDQNGKIDGTPLVRFKSKPEETHQLVASSSSSIDEWSYYQISETQYTRELYENTVQSSPKGTIL